MHIRRNDIVVAIAGRNAGTGKTGKVLQVIPNRGMAIVEGFNLVKKSMRKSQDNPQGGIGEKESPLAISNLLLYCPNCKNGARTATITDGNKKLRKCKRCSHTFDS